MFGFNKPGLSPETSIKVQNVGEEYEYIDAHFDDYRMSYQRLETIDGKNYDVLYLRETFGSKEIRVYFDVEQLFS